MYHGKCLCGKVIYRIDGKIEDAVMCHCSLCRKAQGSAFATNGNVKVENFELVSGEAELSRYPMNNNCDRYFCQNCGSPVMAKFHNKPKYVRIRLGLIEGDISEPPVAHIFTTSKANWEKINDDLPQFEGHIKP